MTPSFISLPIARAVVSQTATATHLHFLEYDPTRQLTESDWELEKAAFSKAMETASDGTEVGPSNPETGNSRTITPFNRFNGPAGSQCRKIRETFTSTQYESPYAATVCRDAGDDWKVTQTD